MPKPILVTSYPSPDLDGFGGAWAYAELLTAQGRPAEARFFERPRGEERYILELFGATDPVLIRDDRVYGSVVLVDASERRPFGDRLDPEKVVEVIDHRTLHEADAFPNANRQIELVGAAATLVAERIHQTGGTPSPLAAALLFGAIASNTANFRASVTTERDRTMARWLASLVTLPDDFVAQLFARKTTYVARHLDQVVLAETAVWPYGPLGLVSMTQLELTDVPSFLDHHRSALLAAHQRALAARGADRGFISLMDFTAGTTTFITDDLTLQTGLTAVTGARFSHGEATIPELLFRKQLGPRLKTYLEANE